MKIDQKLLQQNEYEGQMVYFSYKNCEEEFKKKNPENTYVTYEIGKPQKGTALKHA
jgi:YHS domain-containing protein